MIFLVIQNYLFFYYLIFIILTGECSVSRFNYRCDSKLANRRILGKEKEPGVGKLGWHGNFDTGFERNIFRLKSRVRVFFFNFFERATVY